MANKTVVTFTLLGLVPLMLGPHPADAIPRAPAAAVVESDRGPTLDEVRARGGGFHGGAHGGFHGGHGAIGRHPGYGPRPPMHARPPVHARPPMHARPPGHRPGYRPPVHVGGGWHRPASYWWRPGAAVAAGAALGFVGAASAASWAGAAPGPNSCWYYTDSSRTRGFWDLCP
jgi:hypothetical protein